MLSLIFGSDARRQALLSVNGKKNSAFEPVKKEFC